MHPIAAGAAWDRLSSLSAPLSLSGAHVRLERLRLEHLPALSEVALDPALWRWSPSLIVTPVDLEAYVNLAIAEAEASVAVPFAIIDLRSESPIGTSRYLSLSRPDRRLEIGATWVARPFQRTAINSEAKLLMLSYCFEQLGLVRVEFKTDALNIPSRRALERIGAMQEGTLRSHRLIPHSGRFRDTVYYSILADEWPAVKEQLKGRLARNASSGLVSESQ